MTLLQLIEQNAKVNHNWQPDTSKMFNADLGGFNIDFTLQEWYVSPDKHFHECYVYTILDSEGNVVELDHNEGSILVDYITKKCFEF